MGEPSEIVDAEVRQSAITSHSIGIPELTQLLAAVPVHADLEDYRRAVVEDNVLGLSTESGRDWRFATLRRLYLLRRDSLLFRSLRDLWNAEVDARPVLAALCALATDTVLRASASVITDTSPGAEVAKTDFAAAIEATYPEAYASSTLSNTAANAYTSWQQSGHLSPAVKGHKLRQPATSSPASVAYALLLGHLQGHRGDALFDTLWTQVLDAPPSHLRDLAVHASQRGMLEFRSAGAVTEVSFKQLLRPVDGQLL